MNDLKESEMFRTGSSFSIVQPTQLAPFESFWLLLFFPPYCLCLDPLEALHRVGELLVGLGDGVSLDEASDGLPEELEVVEGVVSLDLLVEVGVKGYLLDVLALAELDEGLAGTVAGVEDLLEDVEDGVGGAVGAVVVLDVGGLDLLLGGEAGSTLHELDDGLGCHAPGLSGEVDALSGALGDVPGGISDKGDAALDTAGAGVLGDGVGLR